MKSKQSDYLAVYSQRVELELDEVINNMSRFGVSLEERVTYLIKSIAHKLVKLYDEKFPHRCRYCGIVYQTRNEYIKSTHLFQSPDRRDGYECRCCVCEKDIMPLPEERRDSREFGYARRRLFDICVQKLETVSFKSHEESVEIVRGIFRRIIRKTYLLGSLENYSFEAMN